MSTIRRTASFVGAAAISLSALGAPVAAHADAVTVNDPRDAQGSLSDIRKVAVNHSAKRVAVVTTVTDLKRRPEGTSSLFVRIDTKPARPGAEFRFVTALEDGTDYNLLRMRNGKPVGKPLTCDHRANLNYKGNKVRFSAARKCLGAPGKIRVKVHTRDLSDASHPITDWLGARNTFTRWVAAPQGG